MFIPTTQNELEALGWDACDIILITGDSYIDSPYMGTTVIGKWLIRHGFRVGILAQPNVHDDSDITRLGEPRLFWGVSSGSVDSMVANYTALKKRRKQDDYTPGGVNNRRPDRAVIVYSNLIRRYFKNTVPIVLGGIEASLRRMAHYDYWSNKIRRSILFDAKADLLIYGMAETTTLAVAWALRSREEVTGIPGICYPSSSPPAGFIELPSFEQSVRDKQAFIESFRLFYDNNEPLTAKGLVQKQDSRWLVQNPPPLPLTTAELDDIHHLSYEREQHPYYEAQGGVRALDTIRFSINTHRGCYGECNFCAIAVHQGRTVQSRSPESILNEAKALTQHPKFRGIINDVGGPTANMYGFECARKLQQGACTNKRCLSTQMCHTLQPSHKQLIRLLQKLRHLDGVKKVFVASGIRYDLVLGDEKWGEAYLQEIVNHHVSGQLKVAPEHTEPHVLRLMNKPNPDSLKQFKKRFDRLSQQAGKAQFLTYYLIAAYPGSSDADMRKLRDFVHRELEIRPEQVQIFTPTPGTWASVMYYAEMDPFTGKPLFVEKQAKGKERQKRKITG